MNRRGFLGGLVKGVAGIVAAAAAPAALVGQEFKWKVARRETGVLVATINPAWENAPYEMLFFFSPDIVNICPITVPTGTDPDHAALPPELASERGFVFRKDSFPPRIAADGSYPAPFIMKRMPATT
jgi:hypothetical protein